MILSDSTLVKYASDGRSIVTPFLTHSVSEDEKGNKIPSYGLSSFGYDVRLAPEFKIFSNVNHDVIDPVKGIVGDTYCDVLGESCVIPPNSYLLGRTVETFDIPEDVLAICLTKSTWARSGIMVNVTPIEPEFKGNVVIEVANLSTLPVRIYANVGIAQFIFYKGDQRPLVTYADKGGKYQHQTGIQVAKP